MFREGGKLSQDAFTSTETAGTPRLGPEHLKMQETEGIIIKYFTAVVLMMKDRFIDGKIRIALFKVVVCIICCGRHANIYCETINYNLISLGNTQPL